MAISRHRSRTALKAVSFRLWLGVIVLWMVFPFYYMIVSSLESGSAIFEPGLLPETVSLSNYAQLLQSGEFLRNVLNSFLISAGVVAISLAVGTPAAWSLARVDFRGRKAVLIGILCISMFPRVAVLPGMYEMFTGTRAGIDAAGLSWSPWLTLGWLVFSYLLFTLPFTTWTMMAYMKAIPGELEEAAIMDGASYPRIVFSIFLPLLWPAIVTTGLLAFVVTWNEFLFALTFTSSAVERTVTVAISMLSGSVEYQIPWGAIMAASVIVTLPLILLVLIFQRRLIANLAGGVKG